MSDSGTDALCHFFNVDNATEWPPNELSGPAISLPDMYKKYRLKDKLYIEFLRMDSKESQRPTKNHVVFQLPFVESHKLQIEGDEIKLEAARISMDLSINDAAMDKIDDKCVEIDFLDKSLGDDYIPGSLNVKMLKYQGQTQMANKFIVFSGLDIPTLGAFVDFIKDHGIHQMSFLLYMDMYWKGCRDFITQAFVRLRAENRISATDEEGHTFKSYITKVHHQGSGSHEKLVDRGKFIRYVRIYPDEIQGAYEFEDEEV